jgi:hypothetical protein
VREPVNDVSSQFEVLEARMDQASTPAGHIDAGAENEACRPTTSADMHHQSATRRNGQQTASEPEMVAVHVSGGWSNNNPFVALSPDHGWDRADQSEELHNGDGLERGGGQHRTEEPTYQPGTGAEADAEWQFEPGLDALRRRFRVAPLSGETP